MQGRHHHHHHHHHHHRHSPICSLISYCSPRFTIDDVSFFFQFVAHPYSQMMLNSVLYDELGGWEDHNFLNKALFCLLLGVLLPVLALCYFVAPNSRISKLLKIPVFKFLSHTASSFWFLVLLVFSSIQDKFSDVLDFAPLGKKCCIFSVVELSYFKTFYLVLRCIHST